MVQEYKDFLFELNEGRKPDWKKRTENYYIYFSWEQDNFGVGRSIYAQSLPDDFYFREEYFMGEIQKDLHMKN